MRDVSVTSRIRNRASKPEASRAFLIRATTLMSESIVADTLIDMVSERPRKCSILPASQAVRKTNSVSASILPAFSHWAMKFIGGMNPLTGSFQRTKASAPVMVPLRVSILG